MTTPPGSPSGRSATQDGVPEVDLLLPAGPDGLPDRSVLGRTASSDTLRDLALDGLVDKLVAGAGEGLREVFATPLRTREAVRFRQAVFADLRDTRLRAILVTFLENMDQVARARSQQRRAHYRVESDIWGAHAAAAYVHTLHSLAAELPAAVEAVPARSEPLRLLARFVTEHAASPTMQALRRDAERVDRGLAEARYSVLVHGARVTIAPTGHEPDLQAQVLAAFERFRQSDVVGDTRARATGADLDHVQAQILDLVARLFQPLFADAALLAATRGIPDATLSSVADQLRFYLAWLDAVAPAEASGLDTDLPEVLVGQAAVHALDTWDIALGLQLVDEKRPVVTNDMELSGDERVLVISGPNQGGKTTFARTFGQLHLLSALGVPVPGRQVRVMLTDQVLTVFEREEVAGDLGGRLGAELARVHALLNALTPTTAVVLNEVFSSTALADARWLARRVLDRLTVAGVPTAMVTFLDELSRLGPATVSVVAGVDPADPAVRTWRLLRQPADGRAYADALAERYGLSAERLARRLTP